MRRVLTTPCERKIPPGTEGNHFYLLRFDGGPRGNPGPGGSGTVVAKVARGTGVYTICWVSSMSYASRTTTNNIAENMGATYGAPGPPPQPVDPNAGYWGLPHNHTSTEDADPAEGDTSDQPVPAE
ncbi:hypothetical protein PC110_g19968 [Phytophthora cactorum]|uniref:Uncharacterized protein n=1 Tax=Phytophthora cactorum TaxID=29920 RepID=A0A329RHK5_9STRA|nr:hypothetical protein PC110_g19968 [Phytophthora cactorum]